MSLPCSLLTRCVHLIPQMADCGGLPQVVQVGWFVSLRFNVYIFLLCTFTLPWSLKCQSENLYAFSQPGKLAEAFKYFVQGMGYSKSPVVFFLLTNRINSVSCVVCLS